MKKPSFKDSSVIQPPIYGDPPCNDCNEEEVEDIENRVPPAESIGGLGGDDNDSTMAIDVNANEASPSPPRVHIARERSPRKEREREQQEREREQQEREREQQEREREQQEREREQERDQGREEQRQKQEQQQESPTKSVLQRTVTPLTADALRENDARQSVVPIMEDTSNEDYNELDGEEDASSNMGAPQGYSGMDDTNFTAFSAVPNTDMTLFAQIGQSPRKGPPHSPAKSLKEAHYGEGRRKPRQSGRSTPTGTRNDASTDCSPSPTPRRPKSSYEPDTTNLILDFTEQFNAISRHSPYKKSRTSPQKSQTQPNLASYLSGRRAPSPTKNSVRPSTPTGPRPLVSLLDFDLPPAPTPRSVPSITARELESLKSSFLSQVSSLRATLSGKDAEVNSLKEAVADAERRVGEALEEIRELKGVQDGLQAEKAAWELRDKEMQNVLRNVKEEIMWADRERDQVQQKLDESESRCLQAEARTIEVQSQLAGLEFGKEKDLDEKNKVYESVSTAVQNLAKELHGLYKSKHEVKVLSLKESYKGRWERRIRELENRVADLSRENKDLRVGKDVTFSAVVSADLPPPAQVRPDTAAAKAERAMEAKRREEQEAKLQGLEQELASTKRDNETLLQQLEKERLGMAELVAATEEMMQLSLQAPPSSGCPPPSNGTVRGESTAAKSLENLRGSISRASSGLRAPNGGIGGAVGGAGPGAESRIGKVNGGRSLGLPVAGTAGGGRIGLKDNHIERTGRGRGAD